MEATRRVDDDDVYLARPACVQRIVERGRGIATLVCLDDMNAGALGPHLKLLDGRGAEGICRAEKSGAMLRTKVRCELARGCGLTRTVHTDHHDDFGGRCRTRRRRLHRVQNLQELKLQETFEFRAAVDAFAQRTLAQGSDDLLRCVYADIRGDENGFQLVEGCGVYLARQGKDGVDAAVERLARARDRLPHAGEEAAGALFLFLLIRRLWRSFRWQLFFALDFLREREIRCDRVAHAFKEAALRLFVFGCGLGFFAEEGEGHRDKCNRSRGWSYSPLPGRVIRARIASRGAWLWWRTWFICSVIGISTPWIDASPSAAEVQRTPSATFPFRLSMISGSFRPLPSSTPTVRLRESVPVQVRTRSPIPARPASVFCSAPQAMARRVISAMPRVISAAAVLLPRLRPVATPAARAMTFLSAPPSSTSTRSELL